MGQIANLVVVGGAQKDLHIKSDSDFLIRLKNAVTSKKSSRYTIRKTLRYSYKNIIKKFQYAMGRIKTLSEPQVGHPRLKLCTFCSLTCEKSMFAHKETQ